MKLPPEGPRLRERPLKLGLSSLLRIPCSESPPSEKRLPPEPIVLSMEVFIAVPIGLFMEVFIAVPIGLFMELLIGLPIPLPIPFPIPLPIAFPIELPMQFTEREFMGGFTEELRPSFSMTSGRLGRRRSFRPLSTNDHIHTHRQASMLLSPYPNTVPREWREYSFLSSLEAVLKDPNPLIL